MFKIVERNSVETPNININLNEQQQFRLNTISEIKDYFVTEIKERKIMSKRLSKYIASFDYVHKSLIVLSATSGNISIASFATDIGAPVEELVQILVLHFRILQELCKNC